MKTCLGEKVGAFHGFRILEGEWFLEDQWVQRWCSGGLTWYLLSKIEVKVEFDCHLILVSFPTENHSHYREQSWCTIVYLTIIRLDIAFDSVTVSSSSSLDPVAYVLWCSVEFCIFLESPLTSLHNKMQDAFLLAMRRLMSRLLPQIIQQYVGPLSHDNGVEVNLSIRLYCDS